MTTTDAINLLRAYNKWRRGAEDIEQPHPTEIGVALDTVLDHIEHAQQDCSCQSLKDLIVEVFEPRTRPTTITEYRALLEWNAGNGIHTCHEHCNRPACRLRRERDLALDIIDEVTQP